MVKINISSTEIDIMIAQSIRKSVFIKENKIPESVERDGKDTQSRHIIAWLNFEPVGCARLKLIEGKFKFDKLAVLDRFRTKGVASAIVNYAVDYASNEGASEIFLHTDKNSDFVTFFKKFGFSKSNNDSSDSEKNKLYIGFD